ncbi:MAG: choline/ethanolamine kinase family protein [Paracoccaceae bacterium]
MSDLTELITGLPCFKAPSNITPLGGGITNTNVTVEDEDCKYVVRIGSDIAEHGVMRWNELALSQAAYKLGISPKVIYHKTGVLVLEFIDAYTLDEAAVREPKNLKRIINVVAKTHRGIGKYLHSPILTFWPFQINQTYMSRLEEDGSSHVSKLVDMKRQLEVLEIATGPVELVVGHNDLLAANILDDGDQLWLIDWEYGGFNTPLFDLAGLAGNNGLSVLQEQQMLEQYFKQDWQNYWRPYNAMKCASLMRETLWSMVSEIYSEIDFDYAAYTVENLNRFNVAMSDFKNT